MDTKPTPPPRYNPNPQNQEERDSNTGKPVVVTVKNPVKKQSEDRLKSPTWIQNEHAPWCAECDVVHAYFEGYGPMKHDCTVLVVNPTNPEGPKHRVLVQLSDVAPIEDPQEPK